MTSENINATVEEVTEALESTELTTLEASETLEAIGVETFPAENGPVENMAYTLPMMGKGMLGIFIVTVIIIISVVILNKVTNRKKS